MRNQSEDERNQTKDEVLKTKKFLPTRTHEKYEKMQFSKILFSYFRMCACVRVGNNLKIFDNFQVAKTMPLSNPINCVYLWINNFFKIWIY